ncbi:unnamed protein product [Urochloa humidicola]
MSSLRQAQKKWGLARLQSQASATNQISPPSYRGHLCNGHSVLIAEASPISLVCTPPYPDQDPHQGEEITRSMNGRCTGLDLLVEGTPEKGW